MWRSLQKLSSKLTNVVMNYSEVETKVREATTDDPWGPTGAQKWELAKASFSSKSNSELLSMLWKRIVYNKHNPRKIYKSLEILHFLVLNGSEYVLNSTDDRVHELEQLQDYYIGIDHKISILPKTPLVVLKQEERKVRMKAKEILELMRDYVKLKAERDAAMKNRDKYVGFGPTTSPYATAQRSFIMLETCDTSMHPESSWQRSELFSEHALNAAAEETQYKQRDQVELGALQSASQVNSISKPTGSEAFPATGLLVDLDPGIAGKDLPGECLNPFLPLRETQNPFENFSLKAPNTSDTGFSAFLSPIHFPQTDDKQRLTREIRSKVIQILQDLEDNDFDPRGEEAEANSKVGEFGDFIKEADCTRTKTSSQNSWCGESNDECSTEDITRAVGVVVGNIKPNSNPFSNLKPLRETNTNPFGDFILNNTVEIEDITSHKFHSTNPFLYLDESISTRPQNQGSEEWVSQLCAEFPQPSHEKHMKPTIWDEFGYLLNDGMSPLKYSETVPKIGLEDEALTKTMSNPTQVNIGFGNNDFNSWPAENNSISYNTGSGTCSSTIISPAPLNPFSKFSSTPDKVLQRTNYDFITEETKKLKSEYGADGLKGTTWEGFNFSMDYFNLTSSSKSSSIAGAGSAQWK